MSLPACEPVANDALVWTVDRTNDPRVQEISLAEPQGWDVRLAEWECDPSQTNIVTDIRPAWFSDALWADFIGQINTAIDIVFDQIDRLLSDGDADTVDAILRDVPVYGPSLTFLMGLLSITLPASAYLPSRRPLFDWVWQSVSEQNRDAEALLGGLRQWSRADGPCIPEQQ